DPARSESTVSVLVRCYVPSAATQDQTRLQQDCRWGSVAASRGWAPWSSSESQSRETRAGSQSRTDHPTKPGCPRGRPREAASLFPAKVLPLHGGVTPARSDSHMRSPRALLPAEILHCPRLLLH